MTDRTTSYSPPLRVTALRAAAFFVVQALLLAWLMRDYETDNRLMLNAANAKHARLAALQSPRLILVGGSNVLFGLDSPTLAAGTGITSVVNMALTAPLGLSFMLQEVQPLIRPGDVVLLSPEYDHFCRDVTSARDLIWLLERRPRAWHDFPAQDIKLVMDRGLHHLASVVRAEAKGHHGATDLGANDLRYVNAYGDNIASRSLPPKPLDPEWRLDCSAGRRGLMQEEVDRVAQFKRDVEMHGGKVLLSYPTFEREAYQSAAADIDRLNTTLQSLFGRALLTEPEETVVPKSELFDSYYHPVDSEKMRRSELVAQRIAEFMNGSSRIHLASQH
jgi:hypothetical protein